MSAAYAMQRYCKKKLLKLGSYLRRDFNSSKCKTCARMTTARIKLLRNKRETIVRQMRRDVALLLQSGQDATARIRVEHVIREQNMMAANEVLELFCERLVTRLSIVAKQKDCPKDLKEAISSLIFAGPRCSDIPELLSIRDIFQKKYGKDFVLAATDLRPNSGVNRLLIEKLSALNPPGELKLKVMKEIAKEYQVEWDTSETESELLKPPEERIDGPQKFVSSGRMPLNSGVAPQSAEAQKLKVRLSGDGKEVGSVNYQNAVSAAKAAADSAKDAVAAAQAAAQLVQLASYNVDPSSDVSTNPINQEANSGIHGREYRSQSLGTVNNCYKSTDMSPDDMDFNARRHSHNPRRAYTDIKFDESDGEVETEMEQQPQSGFYGKPGNAASVHPKLPDYDEISTRFEALKYRKT